MKKSFTYIMACLAAVMLLSACGGARLTGSSPSSSEAASRRLSALSHNDSLRFKVYFFEAVSRHLNGEPAAAYDLLRHCLDINPNAAEAYYMMSFYDGVLHGDTAALEDIKKASELSPDNDTYLDELGKRYYNIEDYDKAIKAYEKLADNEPDNADVLNRLLALYQRTFNYDKMIDVINRKETLEGPSEELTIAKMLIYSDQGKKDKEFNELKSMADKYPNDMNYKVMMGNWLLQNDRVEEAGRQYREVMAFDPGNIPAKMSMIDFYRKIGQTQQADSLQEVLLVDPKTSVADKLSIMRQVVVENEKPEGDSSKVIDLFRRILAKPQETSDMAELYAHYLTLKDMPKDSIISAFENVLRIAPDNNGSRMRLLQMFWADKDFDCVIECARQGIDYSPDQMFYYYFVGVAYIQKDDNDSALDALLKGVSQKTTDSDVSLVSDMYGLMGDLYYEKKLEEKAYAAYDSCLQLNADNYGCLNNYAYYLSMSGRELEKAAQMSFRTVQAEPDNSTFLDTYAWILFLQKKYGDARQYIDMAVDNDTTKSSVILEHAGDIHAVAGDIDSALKYWNEALQAGSDNDKAIRRKIKLRKYVEDK